MLQNPKPDLKAEEDHRSFSQRWADAVTEFCGSWTFIIWFSAITLGWMSFNTFKIFTEFDPYPYILLNLFLTVVSTFQSPLIMMSQNRQADRDREAVLGIHAKLDVLLQYEPELEGVHQFIQMYGTNKEEDKETQYKDKAELKTDALKSIHRLCNQALEDEDCVDWKALKEIRAIASSTWIK